MGTSTLTPPERVSGLDIAEDNDQRKLEAKMQGGLHLKAPAWDLMELSNTVHHFGQLLHAGFPSQRQSLREKQRDLQLVLQVPFTDASGEKTGWLPNASKQPFEGDCWGHKRSSLCSLLEALPRMASGKGNK